MTLIDEIVEVNITHTANPISQVGLNILLIIGDSKKTHRVKTYSHITEVRADYELNAAEYKAASLALGQKGRPAKILIGQVMDNETFVDAYQLITRENKNFYGVVITSKKIEDQLAISEAIEAEEKIFGLSSDDKNILVGNNEEHILHKLHALKRKRTFVIYHGDGGNNYIEAAWFGLMFSYEAGSATWNFKSLSGVAADNLSTSDRGAITLKGGNYFVPLGNNSVMIEGRAVNCEWLDAIQGIDWLNNKLKSSIANVFANAAKIPYTADGLAIIENMVRYSLSAAATRQIIDTSFDVFTPQIADIALEYRANRILPDIKFDARLSGALHKMKINGTIIV
ncbi:MAG: DUF3383 family protein [Janthinobacterium lividum]